MVSNWPNTEKQFIDKKAEQQMQAIISCITAIRNIRSVWEINPSKRIKALLCLTKKPLQDLLNSHASYIKDLARIESLEIGARLRRPESSAVAVIAGVEIFVPLKGIINVQKEAKRLKGRLKDLEGFLQNSAKKLKNKQFLKKAPKEIVDKEQEKAKQLKESIKKLKDNLKGFSSYTRHCERTK